MELQLAGASGSAGKVSVSDAAFSRDFNESLIHQMVTAYLSAGRAGTHAQKTRSEVRGGGRKPFSQKGSGRARAGTIRSPLWRGGGKIFAAVTQDYSQKVNKKMYRAALSSILSELIRQDRLVVVNEFKAATPKTKDVVAQLKKLSMTKGLIVTDATDNNLQLATRNIPHVDTCSARQVNPVNLIGADKVLMTVAALKQIEEMLA